MIGIDAHDGDLTRVELTWVEGRTEYWIRFGHEAGTQILDRNRRVVSFGPGSVFAFVRWAANDYGTINSRIDIVRAVEPGEAYQTLPFVRPGGEILLKIEGWPKVEAANDAACLGIWAETRDRFLGRTPAPSTPGPDEGR